MQTHGNILQDTKSEHNNTAAPLLSKTVVIVGGGPIGLAHAWGIKKLNPNIKVVVLEKYAEYQRSHTLIMQHKALSALMKATNAAQDPTLTNLLAQLKKDPHIRTNELEKIFKNLATTNGVIIENKELKDETIHDQLNEYKPDLIIGADGTHSTVSRCLFPQDNQVKIAFDYVLQLRYEVNGDEKASPITTTRFYQHMARHGMIANEYVGRYDQEKKKTPITMQMMISKEAFTKLYNNATSKKPIKPFSDEKKSDNSASEYTLNDIPSDIRSFITNYLREKVNPLQENIDHDSIRISVNEAPATYAKQSFHMLDNNVPAVLRGDAELGLSYFKGLNAGLEAAAEFFTFLSIAIKMGLTNIDTIKNALSKYNAWFLKDFAPKKIKEVEEYSTWQIRLPMRLMEAAKNISESSMRGPLTHDDVNILEDYFKLFSNTPYQLAERIKTLYPHREHDIVTLWQLSYVSPKYTLKKTGKLFIDYFKPYKSTFHVSQDFKQPLVGLANLTVGSAKLISGLFTSGKRFVDGLTNIFRGTIEVGTTPLAWIVKPITRGLTTLITGQPKIEDNPGMKKLAMHGLKLLQETNNESKDPMQKYKLLAVADDLHRKFNKALNRKQNSKISSLDEEQAFCEARRDNATINTGALIRYFSFFSQEIKLETSNDATENIHTSLLKNT